MPYTTERSLCPSVFVSSSELCPEMPRRDSTRRQRMGWLPAAPRPVAAVCKRRCGTVRYSTGRGVVLAESTVSTNTRNALTVSKANITTYCASITLNPLTEPGTLHSFVLGAPVPARPAALVPRHANVYRMYESHSTCKVANTRCSLTRRVGQTSTIHILRSHAAVCSHTSRASTKRPTQPTSRRKRRL